jgi:hypothetical protein
MPGRIFGNRWCYQKRLPGRVSFGAVISVCISGTIAVYGRHVLQAITVGIFIAFLALQAPGKLFFSWSKGGIASVLDKMYLIQSYPRMAR